MNMNKKQNLNLMIVLALFITLSLVYIEYPGMFLDAVNPEYMGLHLFHSDNVPVWAYSDNVLATLIEGTKEYSHLPLLNSLYGTCFEAYAALIWGVLFGYGVFALRTLHIVYLLLALIGIYLLVKCVASTKLALLGVLLLSLDPTFLFSSRTQYYIQFFPCIFWAFGLFLLLDSFDKDESSKKIFWSAVLLGLSACCYFIFAFYFLAIFMVCIIIWKMLQKGVLNNCKKMILGFLLGYIPFIYAHISIIITQGVDGWIGALKGLETYGITQGQSASFFERGAHILQEMLSISGGSNIISMMTGKTIGSLYGQTIFILYITCFVLSIIIVKKKNRIFKNAILICILDSIFLIHILLAFIIGNSLGHQHFIMLLPIMYLTIILTVWECYLIVTGFIKTSEGRRRIQVIIKLVICVCIMISGIKVGTGYFFIKETKGIGYYSEVINNISYYLESAVSDSDIIISPQWGYWMQIVCITNGEKQVWADTDANTIEWRLANTNKSGKCYVIVDNSTDIEMIKRVMETCSYNKEQEIIFKDYGDILNSKILVYEKVN